MIEKIDLENEPFKDTNRVIDTLNRLWIIAEKLNEVIDAVNSIEGALSSFGGVSYQPYHGGITSGAGTHEDGAHYVPVCCVCGHHKRGESTGGWYCPLHGRQF